LFEVLDVPGDEVEPMMDGRGRDLDVCVREDGATFLEFRSLPAENTRGGNIEG
jgi:hypothetical protein